MGDEVDGRLESLDLGDGRVGIVAAGALFGRPVEQHARPALEALVGVLVHRLEVAQWHNSKARPPQFRLARQAHKGQEAAVATAIEQDAVGVSQAAPDQVVAGGGHVL